MQPFFDLGTVPVPVPVLLQGEVDRDIKAVPELLKQINANNARITELINTYTVKPPGASKGWQNSVSKTRCPP